jgi:hypothetical protein
MKLFKPSTPKVEAPSPMPDEQDPALLEARRRKQAEMAARGGRQSTILSDNLTGSVGKAGA